MEALCATTPKEIDEGDFFKSTVFIRLTALGAY